MILIRDYSFQCYFTNRYAINIVSPKLVGLFCFSWQAL